MTKVPDSETTLELMVNCKTYPAVSKTYIETVCTGGVDREGNFIRLYPVPFRFLNKEQRYDRWDVIRVRAYRDTKDPRPESWHWIGGTSIEKIDRIESENQRWQWMKKTVHTSTEAMESNGITNGCVEIEPIDLYFEADEKEWTPSQIAVLQQGDLFSTPEQWKELAERVPWQFRLAYKEKSTGRVGDSKVLSWGYYQGYRRAKQDLGDDELALEHVASNVRNSIFNPGRTVFAILGTHSRFGNWLISALYHVPTSVIEKDKNRGAEIF